MKPKTITIKIPRELTQKQAKRLAGVQSTMPSAANAFKRVFTGVGTQRTAIKCFCLDCCGLDRAAITECAADACPLYAYRPFQRKAK